MTLIEGSGDRGLALKLSILAMGMLFLSAPALAASHGGSQSSGHHHVKTNYDPDLLQSVTNACQTGSGVSSCSGGYSTTQTFGSPLPLGDVVTFTITFAPTTANTAVLGVSDSLGNTVTVTSSQCTTGTSVLCTAVGYFLVIVAGTDDIVFSVAGGTSGCLHYTAQDWYAANSALLTPLASSGSCGVTCTTALSVPAITFVTPPNEVIAIGAFQAVFNQTLSSWTPTLPYYAFANNDCSGRGYAILFQATNSTSTSFNFGSTTTVAPTVFAGSAELLYY